MNRKDMSCGYKRYALAIIVAVYTLNLLDRGLMGLLMQPIKEDLHLSDTQLGFLTGMAFGLFYATLGVPIGRWADRGNRVTIASFAIALWGLTVMVCLLVTNFVQLVFARMAAAVGESGCKPPTYSLVGDYFPRPAERVRAMSIYWLAGPIAALVSYTAGGWLNEMYGWRMTFFLIGIPGLLLAILVKCTVVEPRRVSNRSGVPALPLPPFAEVLAMLWRRRSCRHLTLALLLYFFMSFGLTPWNASFMMRSHGMGTAELGVWLGLITAFGGGAGLLSGGYIAARWFANDERGQMRMNAVAVALAIPCYVAFLTVPRKDLALLVMVPWMLLLGFIVAPTYALLQRLVPDEVRATTMAVVMLLYNLIGMGIAPQVVGWLSDRLMPALGRDSLRWALFMMSFVGLWSAYHFVQIGRTVQQDLSEVADRRRLVSAGAVLSEGY